MPRILIGGSYTAATAAVHRITGFQPVARVLASLRRSRNKQSREQSCLEKSFAAAIALPPRGVRGYTHHGLKTRDTLLLPPRRPVRAVFQDQAELAEPVADGVGQLEVL